MYKFNKDDYREFMKIKQYEIFGSHEKFLASRYGDDLSYNDIVKLHNLAIEETLIINNIEVLTDLPWGKGLKQASDRWVELMKTAIKIRKENENKELWEYLND